jgi:hypothetical protein
MNSSKNLIILFRNFSFNFIFNIKNILINMSKDAPDVKPIGIWSAVAIGVDGMVGAGIFP